MGWRWKGINLWRTYIHFLIVVHLVHATSVTVKDVFTPESPLTRLPRASNRYGSAGSSDKSLKPEESLEARENSPSATLGKRCIRCESGYQDRYPSSYDRSRYDDRSKVYDRYDDRYDDRDRYHDRDRYNDHDRYSYDRYDRYSDRDRYYDRDRDGYGERERYPDRDRYGYRDRYSDNYDRYDPYENRDRYDRYDRNDRYPDRGVGYDNRGYDYRGSDRNGYRPLDETYKGSSGFDDAGRGYYFASGRPQYGASSGYGNYGGGGYASGWTYGNSGGGRDDYYRDRGGGYRPSRDPYADGYRTTSYLHERPSTTTSTPPSDSASGNVQLPQENSG